MNWYKFSKKQESKNEITKKIKDLIKENTFCNFVFNVYNTSLKDIDEMSIRIVPLKNENAKSDSKGIYLDEKLFKNTEDIKNKMHFIIHELIHWLNRQKENDIYFYDKEEYESFSSSIAYEILNGKKYKDLYITFFPIIIKHFNNEKNAKKFFDKLIEKAKLKIKEYNLYKK